MVRAACALFPGEQESLRSIDVDEIDDTETDATEFGRALAFRPHGYSEFVKKALAHTEGAIEAIDKVNEAVLSFAAAKGVAVVPTHDQQPDFSDGSDFDGERVLSDTGDSPKAVS